MKNNSYRNSLPPYGHAVENALAKNRDKLIVIRYGNDAWTHAKAENDSFFGDTNPETLVMPEHDHWTNYRWPLYNARVFVDWMFAPQSQTDSFVEFLLKHVRVREVSFYTDTSATNIRSIKREGSKLVVLDIGSGKKWIV